jgi:hypothetical protein
MANARNMEKAATTTATPAKIAKGIDSADLMTFTTYPLSGRGQFARKSEAVTSRFSGKHTTHNTIVDNAHISGGIMKVAHQEPAT